MEKKIEILNELKQISEAVAAIERTNTYSVPDGYFIDFPAKLMTLIDAEPAFLNRKQAYQVPEGYFDNFAATVLARVKTNEVYEELEQIAPFLNTISKTNVYTVPNEYFEQVNHKVKEQATPETARVVLMKPVHSLRRYAIAAALTAVVAFSGYFLSIKNGNGNQAMTSSVTGVGAGNLVPSNADIQTEVAKVSQDDIENFLKSSPSLYDAAYSIPEEEININEAIDDAKDAELEKYINDMPATYITDKKSSKQI